MKKLLALSLAACLSLSLLSGCTPPVASTPTPPAPTATPVAPVEGPISYADTVAWDGQYDVVVVGFGAAGSVAAMNAADAGARVLLVEKAPEGHEGGNTRYCGQLVVGADDYDTALHYYKQLYGPFEIDDALLETFVRGITESKSFLTDKLGVDEAEVRSWRGVESAVAPYCPEYPELEGNETITLYTISDKFSNGALWQVLRANVTDRADSIDVWFESPATKLIQDPQSKAILGVEVQRDGKAVNIQAANGVVLATGGFENNAVMVEDYLGLPHAAAVGGTYNTGDGIRMASEVGADLWHMNAYEGINILGGSSFMVEEGERAVRVGGQSLVSGSVMLLAADGNRYLREDETTRHGHIYEGGIWVNPNRPLRSFIVFDQVQADLIAEKKAIPADYQSQIIKADTLETLAQATEMDPANLANTVKNFNSYAATGIDLEYGREPASMKALSQAGPYYAIEIMPAILNTQGGPRRNENAEVLDYDGKPIPRLYSAGEMGGMTALHYQGASNIAECFIFGEIAGKNAAADKGALPVYTAPVKVTSTPAYTPGSETDISAAPEIALSANEYLGMGEGGMGGPLYAKVTMDGDKIAKVEVVQHAESAGISDPALEQIPAAIVSANSPDVDTVAGATMTSTAIKNAVKDALAQIKK